MKNLIVLFVSILVGGNSMKTIVLLVILSFSVAPAVSASSDQPTHKQVSTILAERQPVQSAEENDIGTSLTTPDIDPGRSGCCSWHGGVCGCSGGRALCCDGTLSPSCGCD